jgi:membrane protease subunit (stomatin/prohibitin family)
MFSKLWEIKKQVELTQNISSGQSSDDPASRIEKLAGLLDKGLITQEEYDKKKAKLLEEI